MEELVRKRGNLRTDGKKTPITNNVLIEKLLGPDVVAGHMGCICVEDVIDVALNCNLEENDEMFKKMVESVWPFQLGSLKETIVDGHLKHDAHGR